MKRKFASLTLKLKHLSAMKIKVDNTISLELVNDRHPEAIFNLVNANRFQLREWLPWVDNMQSVDFIKNFINGSLKRNADKSEFAFVIIFNSRIVGRIGIYNIDHQNKIAAIGYWLDGNVQGKGIVTKSCQELISFCFNTLQLNRIEIKCGTENYKSQTIPEKLNFKKEGTIRMGEFLSNKNMFIDLYSYSLIKDDWNTHSNG